MRDQTTEQIEAGTPKYNTQSSNISFYAGILSLSGIILCCVSIFTGITYNNIDFIYLYAIAVIINIVFGITSVYYGNKTRANKDMFTKSELSRANAGVLLSLITTYFALPLLSVFLGLSTLVSVVRTH